MVKISVLVIACVIGIALALLSVLIERRGPELLAYGNLCGPNAGQECFEPALEGGFPLTYLTDMPGVSVEHQLSFGEDTLHATALVIDVAFYITLTLCLLWLASWRRPGGANRPTGCTAAPDRHAKPKGSSAG